MPLLIKSYLNLLRRSPVARTISLILLVVLIVLVTFKVNVKKKPFIESVSPLVGKPGDEMTITGSGFGKTRETSFVEIAGSRITESNYLSWSEDEIHLTLPPNIQDGLVIVGTPTGKSKPAFFANEVGIPIAVREASGTSKPVINSVSTSQGGDSFKSSVTIGQTIRILGANFGSTRGTSEVFFTANRERSSLPHSEQNPVQQESVYIPASVADMDYISWSDSEISVRVPDGATSGSFFVETSRGASDTKKLSVSFPAGKKEYFNMRTYVVQVTADIANHVSKQDSSITLYIPRPTVSSFQPSVELNEVTPEPFIQDDPQNIIHKKKLSQASNEKERFSQTFIVRPYSVKSEIDRRHIAPYKKSEALYLRHTAKDPIVPSDEKAVLSLLEKIIGEEKNPVNQAELIYKYFTDNFKINEKVRSGDASVLDLIRLKSGDAYDFAIMYTALCRAAGIPAIPVGGILVHNRSKVTPHWWTELYFEDFGWFPVDIALGSGLPFSSFIDIKDHKEFYFGNIDNQHIAFSRGWQKIRQSSQESKIVYRPRTYALQSLWEEAEAETSSYSSLWNNPVIQGIY